MRRLCPRAPGALGLCALRWGRGTSLLSSIGKEKDGRGLRETAAREVLRAAAQGLARTADGSKEEKGPDKGSRCSRPYR